MGRLDNMIPDGLRSQTDGKLMFGFTVNVPMRETEAKIFSPKTQLRHNRNRRHQSTSEDTIGEPIIVSSSNTEELEETIDKLASENGNQTSINEVFLPKQHQILQQKKNNSSNHKISFATRRILTVAAEGKSARTLEMSYHHLRTLAETKR